MSDDQKNIIYTAEDIRQYLSGRLSPLQMHAMEKAALDDEFLAEAIEGYEGVKEDNWKKGLINLQNKFAPVQTEAKIIQLTTTRKKNNWWKIAAAVLLIASTAAISYILINKQQSPVEIAQKTVPEKTTAPLADIHDSAQVIALVPETVVPNSPTERKVPDKKEEPQVIAYQNNPTVSESKADTAFVYTAPAAQIDKETLKQRTDKTTDDIALAKPATAAAPQVNYYNYKKTEKTENKASENWSNANGLSNNGIVLQKSREGYAFDKAVPAREQLLNQVFRAQVVGPDNTALPYANISIKSENFGTYADVKGNFSLVSTDSLLTVEVKAAGYQPRFYTLQSFAQQNKIVLAEEDATARYKAVTSSASGDFAKSKLSRKATLLKDSVVNVEPADGWDNYITYVNNNIDIPDDILQKNIHGQVELSFDVRSNGTITNIKVDKSLCDNCDQLAKRLIEQGPQWKVKKGKKRKGKVTVQF